MTNDGRHFPEHIPSPFPYDPQSPLTQVKPWESKRSVQALRDYADLGLVRTLPILAVRYQQSSDIVPTKSLSTLKKWCNFMSWVERVERYDAIQREAKEAINREMWRERREAILAQDYAQGERLRTLAEEMLNQAPNFIKSRRQFIPGDPAKNIPDREVITLALDWRLMIVAIEKGSELQRMGAGLETLKILHEFTNLSDDQLLARYRQLLASIGLPSAGDAEPGNSDTGDSDILPDRTLLPAS